MKSIAMKQQQCVFFCISELNTSPSTIQNSKNNGTGTQQWTIFRCVRRIAKNVCLSIRPHGTTQLHQTYFHEIWYLSIFRKHAPNIQVSVKMDKNTRYIMWKAICIFDHISLISSYNEKCFSQICRENQNIQFTSVFFFAKNLLFLDNVQRYRTAGQGHRWQNGAWPLQAE